MYTFVVKKNLKCWWEKSVSKSKCIHVSESVYVGVSVNEVLIYRGDDVCGVADIYIYRGWYIMAVKHRNVDISKRIHSTVYVY